MSRVHTYYGAVAKILIILASHFYFLRPFYYGKWYSLIFYVDVILSFKKFYHSWGLIIKPILKVKQYSKCIYVFVNIPAQNRFNYFKYLKM